MLERPPAGANPFEGCIPDIGELSLVLIPDECNRSRRPVSLNLSVVLILELARMQDQHGDDMDPVAYYSKYCP